MSLCNAIICHSSAFKEIPMGSNVVTRIPLWAFEDDKERRIVCHVFNALVGQRSLYTLFVIPNITIVLYLD